MSCCATSHLRCNELTVTVLPVSGNLVVQSVATLKPLLQQLRVDGPFVQAESLSTAIAREAEAKANRPAPTVFREYIMIGEE